jgi:hypothetical protein
VVVILSENVFLFFEMATTFKKFAKNHKFLHFDRFQRNYEVFR